MDNTKGIKKNHLKIERWNIYSKKHKKIRIIFRYYLLEILVIQWNYICSYLWNVFIALLYSTSFPDLVVFIYLVDLQTQKCICEDVRIVFTNLTRLTLIVRESSSMKTLCNQREDFLLVQVAYCTYFLIRILLSHTG